MAAATRYRRLPAGANAPVVLTAGIAAYVVAVMHRTSFGVAGIEASHRFGTTATVLGLFVVVQLAVYAGMQVPVGVLLDRFGSRRLITFGLLVAALGQMVLAEVGSVGWALGARALIGAGDACIFISVLRLLPAWLPARRVPVMTQLVGTLGQTGQVLSAVPLLSLLTNDGWNAMFRAAAVVGVLTAVAAFALIRDSRSTVAPPATAAHRTPAMAGARHGTWLGFWTHFVTGFPSMVVVMLWGVPFLISGELLTAWQAGALLIVNTVVSIGCAPVVGLLTARFPRRRSWIVLASSAATACAWIVLLASPDPLPFWALAIWMAVTAAGGPVSLIGFDFARTMNPAGRLGRANGTVNVGGALATVLSILAVALVLDAVSPDGAKTYDLDAYRLAFSTLAVPWLAGVTGVVVSRRRARAAVDGASAEIGAMS